MKIEVLKTNVEINEIEITLPCVRKRNQNVGIILSETEGAMMREDGKGHIFFHDWINKDEFFDDKSTEATKEEALQALDTLSKRIEEIKTELITEKSI